MMQRKMKGSTFWKTFCLVVLSAVLFMALLTAGYRQKPQAAERLDNILVKAPDEHVTDFALSASSVDSVTLTWTKASDAQTYYISYWESGKPSTSMDREDIGNVSECKITNLKQTKYIFQIQPANKLHTGIPLKGAIASTEGAPSPSAPSKITFNHVKQGYCSVKIDGLEKIYQSEAEIYDASGNFIESSEGDYAGAVIEDNDIRANGFYAVRVRGIYDQAGGYRSEGEWSSLNYIAASMKPDIRFTQKNGRVNAKWNQVQGAQSYTVSVSKNASSGFKKAASVKSPAAVLTKYGSAKLKPGKTYYVKITARMTRDGENYTMSSPAVKIKIKQ